MVRQLVPAITPLLIGKRDAAIHCARAVMDFVTLAQYISHDENTLSYMEHSLYRLDRLKTVFSKYRPQNTTDDPEDEDEGLFNIPKLHVMTHYVAFIRLYGSAQGFDTSSPESAHKTHLKQFFPRTNGNEGWETQILQHNIRRHNVVAMNDIQFWLKTKGTSVTKNSWKVGLTTANHDPMILPKRLTMLNEERLADFGLRGRGWYTAGDIADDEDFGCFEFIDALAVAVI